MGGGSTLQVLCDQVVRIVSLQFTTEQRETHYIQQPCIKKAAVVIYTICGAR